MGKVRPAGQGAWATVSLIRLFLVASRWRQAGLALLLAVVMAAAFGGSVVQLPMIEDRVPLRTLLLIAVCTLTFPSLTAAVEVLERTSPRRRTVLAIRAGLYVAGASVTWLASSLAGMGMSEAAPWSAAADLTLAAALVTSGLVAIVGVGSPGWFAPASLGLVALFVSASPTSPVRAWLEGAPAGLNATAVAAGVAAYVMLGPRSASVDNW